MPLFEAIHLPKKSEDSDSANSKKFMHKAIPTNHKIMQIKNHLITALKQNIITYLTFLMDKLHLNQ